MIKTQDFLKKENQNLVLGLILDHGPISRAEIAKETKMSPTSASRIVASLIENDLIHEIRATRDKVGRKATYFVPNENATISIGVEIAQKVVRIGFMNFIGELFRLQEYDYVPEDPLQTINFVAESILDMIKKEDNPREKFIGVCVGLPGLIKHEEGIVKLSAQFNWKEIRLAEQLKEKLELPIYIDNELKLQAFAEYYNDTNDQKDNMVMIGFGSGVGSALVSKGEIYRGEGNFSGEVGHTVVDPYGTYCPCGNFGCLQTYIAEKFLLDEASKTKKVKSIHELILEAKKGEKWANNILDKATTYAAITVNNIVCVNNPDAVVLSGSLIEDHPEIKDEVLQKCKDQIWSPVIDSFQLGTSKMGCEGVVVGAAHSVQRLYLKEINFDGVVTT